jgi:hypothetical protein
MKLVIESDGTAKGTRLEFSMRGDEIPNMIRRYQKRRPKRVTPPDVLVMPMEVVEMPPQGSISN